MKVYFWVAHYNKNEEVFCAVDNKILIVLSCVQTKMCHLNFIPI